MSLAPALGAPLNCGTLVGATAPAHIFAKAPVASPRFRLRVTPITRVSTPASSATVTDKDRVVSRVTGDTLITDYEVAVEYLVPDTDLSAGLVFSSSNTATLQTPANNIAQAVAPGNVILKATAPTGEFAAVAIRVEYRAGATSDTFIEYVAAAAASNATAAVDDRIANKDATAKPIYSTQNHETATYVRNPNCWAASLDLTCISPWNSTGGGTRAGTLISPRHVLFCEHLDFHPTVGATIRFIAADNTVETRTITALATHPDYTPNYQYTPHFPDITIGVLDSDVPNTISFAKVLPQNWGEYFPSVGAPVAGLTIPSLVLDQEEKALVADWRSSSMLNYFALPVNAQRQIFFETIISGDSGNPAFLIINDELVVLNTWTFGGAGSGTNLVPHKDAINTMMTSLGGGYQLAEVDLSGFPAY